MNTKHLKILGITIAGLGFTSTAGSQGFLQDYIGYFSYVGAAAIELSFICLASITAGAEVKEELRKTARFVVVASVLFNFGHAYQVKVPHGLDSAGPAWDWLAAFQAALVALLIPVIALKLSGIKARLESVAETAKEIKAVDKVLAADKPKRVRKPAAKKPKK